MRAWASTALICSTCAALLADVCSPTYVPSSLDWPTLSSDFFLPEYFCSLSIWLKSCPPLLLSPHQNKGMKTREQQIIKSQQKLHRLGFSNIKCFTPMHSNSSKRPFCFQLCLLRKTVLAFVFFSYSLSCLWRAACSSHPLDTVLLSVPTCASHCIHSNAVVAELPVCCSQVEWATS